MNTEIVEDKSLVGQLAGMSPAEQFTTLDDYIVSSIVVRARAGLILCQALALAKQNWESFPLEELSEWEYNFYKYAKARTGGYARVTIDNLVNVGTTWLVDGQLDCIPETVQLYDGDGKPTDKTVAPNVWELSSSKLLVATGAAKDGRLGEDPVALGQLFNPDVSVHTLDDTIQGRTEKLPLPNNNDTLKLWVEGHYIMVSKNGETDWLCELNTDPTRGRAYNAGYRYLLAALRITE